MRKTVKKMLLVSMLGSMCFVGKSQCEDICDIKQSANGLCTICYNECSDTGQTTYLSCSIAMGEEGQEQELTQTMCKGLCYPQEYPQLQVNMASLTQGSSVIVEQQNENEVEGQQNLLTQNQNMIDSQGQIEPSLMFEEQLPIQENQQNPSEQEVQQYQNEQEVDDQELYEGLLNENEEIAEFDGEMNEQDKEIGGWNEQTNGEEGQQIIEESGQNYQNEENQEDYVDEQEQNWQDEQNIDTEEQQNLLNEQQGNYDQNEEVYQDGMDEVEDEENNLQEEEEYYEQEDNQQYQQQEQQEQQQEQQQEWKQDQVSQQDENVQNNPSLTSQQEANLQEQQPNDQQQTQQPVTSTQQTSNTQEQQQPQSVSSEQQPQLTVQQLKKLKQQTQGWVPTNQNLLKILLTLIISSITFVVAFTQIYKCIDKRRKLKQLQQKHNKEWVKCFQKVANSDTTIGSVSSRQCQAFSTQEVQKQPETN